MDEEITKAPWVGMSSIAEREALGWLRPGTPVRFVRLVRYRNDHVPAYVGDAGIVREHFDDDTLAVTMAHSRREIRCHRDEVEVDEEAKAKQEADRAYIAEMRRRRQGLS